jgi:hypothetical protein
MYANDFNGESVINTESQVIEREHLFVQRLLLLLKEI